MDGIKFCICIIYDVSPVSVDLYVCFFIPDVVALFVFVYIYVVCEAHRAHGRYITVQISFINDIINAPGWMEDCTMIWVWFQLLNAQ